jgi:hypothetical protein
MATTGSNPTVKKRNDAYTGILAISLFAMVGACVMLYLELQTYEGKQVPAAPKIDVPGAMLKSDPKSGNPPPPKALPKQEVPEDPNAPMKDMNPADGKEQPKTGSLPPDKRKRPEGGAPVGLPPIPPVEVAVPTPVVIPSAQPAESKKTTEPVIQIPEIASPTAPEDPINQAPQTKPAQSKPPVTQPKPVVPTEPNGMDDPPPLPGNRALPPE